MFLKLNGFDLIQYQDSVNFMELLLNYRTQAIQPTSTPWVELIGQLASHQHEFAISS